GKSSKEIPFETPSTRVIPHAEKLLLVAPKDGGQKVIDVDLASGKERTEELGVQAPSALTQAGAPGTRPAASPRPAGARPATQTNAPARQRNQPIQAR